MRLVIVESPAKARTLSSFLGPDVLVRATKGYVRRLPTKRLGIAVNDGYRAQFRMRSSFRKELAAIRSEAHLCAEVLIATDPDPAGELIAEDLEDLLSRVPVPLRRVIISDLTAGSVREALENPAKINTRLSAAQRTRHVIDRLFGYRTSRFLSLALRTSKPQGAGRLQSAMLIHIADAPAPNDDPLSSLGLELELWTENGKRLVGLFERHPDCDLPLDGTDVRVHIGALSKERFRLSPPSPHTTAGFLAAFTRSGEMNASEGMWAAQRLYEAAYRSGGSSEGLISYPRTDKAGLLPVHRARVRSAIRKRWGDDALGDDNHPDDATGHGGLCPTAPMRLPSTLRAALSPADFRAYAEIWSTAMASEMRPATCEKVVLGLTHGEGRKIGDFRVLRLVGNGFLRVSDDTGFTFPWVPEFATVDPVRLRWFACPKARSNPVLESSTDGVSEAACILEMARQGVGRPGSYADALQKLVDRKYVCRRHGRLQLTQSGSRVASCLKRYLPGLFSGHATQRLQSLLEEVAAGRIMYAEAVATYDRKVLMPCIDDAETVLEADRRLRDQNRY